MTKILLGLGAAIVIAVAGFFGFDAYMQHRVKSEVEAAFAQIRENGAKASHGTVAFDLWSRTVTIADIAIEQAAEPPLSVKIASVTASGVSRPDPARFSADSIDVADVEVGVSMPAQGLSRVTYKVPRIAVKAYSGPVALQRPPASSSVVSSVVSSVLELYRFAFAQLAGISAASITAANVTETLTLSATAHGGDGEFAYSGIAIEGLKDGKIASIKADGLHFLFDQPAGPIGRITGDVAALVANDIDAGALAAVFDPKIGDDREYRVYSHISAGPWVMALPQGLSLRIDGMSIDDVAYTPSRMQLPALMAAMPQAGAAPPTPAQMREILERVAGFYEGARVGNAEMHGLAVQTPQGPFKLGAMRFNLANGKIGEIAIEGLEGRAPKGPFKLGRFALKSIDIANLMRTTAQFAAQKPSVEQSLALLPLIEGVEIKALAAPYKDAGKQVDIDIFSLDWGQFVGPIPSKLHLVAKMSGPLDATDPGQQKLIAAGIDKLTIAADLGAAWTEAARSFALAPVQLDIGGLFNASARFSLANVSRETFSTAAAPAMGAATQIEAGAIELTLHDVGGVDLTVADVARTRTISREAARQAIVQTIRDAGTPEALQSATDALVSFVETPGQTLVVKLTPLGKVPALQLIQLLKTEPLLALMQFQIEASTGL
jgi:hypothetical protein